MHVDHIVIIHCLYHFQITVILLNWVSSHFSDFEGHEYMTEFLDWFEAMLLEDVS